MAAATAVQREALLHRAHVARAGMTLRRMRDAVRAGFAACAGLFAAASLAAEPVRVLDRAGVVLQRIVPASDGSLAIVSEDEVDLVHPRPGPGRWPVRVIAEASDAQMFAGAWESSRGWWLVRQDALDDARTLWSVVLIGPVRVADRRRPAPVAATAVRRCQPLSGAQVLHASEGDRWLARVAGEDAGDRGALHAFDGRGAPDPRFGAAAADALGGLAPGAFTVGAGGSWWVSATDGPSLHERTTLVKLGSNGRLVAGFGEGGRLALAPSGEGAPRATRIVSHELLDDGAGVLWAMVSGRDPGNPPAGGAAVRRDEVLALSSDTGRREVGIEPPPVLQRMLWSDAQADRRVWSGFVRGATTPTACVAAERPAGGGWSLRCIVRSDGAWRAFGEPVVLDKVGRVADIVADPGEAHRLIVGAEREGHVVVLFAWQP